MGGWSRAACCGMLVVFLLLPFCFRWEGGTVHNFVVCWLFVLFLQFVFRWEGGLVHHFVEFWLCLLLLPFLGGWGWWSCASFCGVLVVFVVVAFWWG